MNLNRGRRGEERALLGKQVTLGKINGPPGEQMTGTVLWQCLCRCGSSFSYE